VNTYEGYLFGHYDSRGGATFVVAPTEQQAREFYAELGSSIEEQMEEAHQFAGETADPNDQCHFMHEHWAKVAAITDRSEFVKHVTEEDFLGKAQITSYRVIKDGEDIEYGECGKPHIEHITANWNPSCEQDPPETIEIKLEPGSLFPEEDPLFGEDAFGLIVNIPGAK